MNKSMYSIMLMDSIVKAIDDLAYENETNRSNLINQILAEYLSIRTPEMHIKEIFDYMTKKMDELSGFKIGVPYSDYMISVKSPLNYKHRPTIKYSVELYRVDENYLGELRVVFRTQSMELLRILSDFFDLWVQLESHYIHKYFKENSIRYSIEDGRFRRTIMMPSNVNGADSELLSRATCEYIKMFDEILKMYLYNPQITHKHIEKMYVDYLNNGLIII